MQEIHRQVHHAAQDQECTFQPHTGNSTEILAGSRRAGQLGQSQAEAAERLAGDGIRKHMVLQSIENLQQQQFSFQPRINPRSRQV